MIAPALPGHCARSPYGWMLITLIRPSFCTLHHIFGDSQFIVLNLDPPFGSLT